jgi:ssDNA-binding replication factor A large subunit
LVVKVVSIGEVADKKRFDGSNSKIAEAVLGDETGIVTFTARNGTV